MIDSLPEMATRPDITAHWESVLTQISESRCRYQDFMQPLRGRYISLSMELNVRRCGSFAALWLLAVVAAPTRKRLHRVM
ncbi:hypothetical protein ACNKHV_08960 [Shigella flexneri]